MTIWALEWRSNNRLDGERRYIIRNEGVPLLFRSRARARAYRDERWGYIRERADLRAEPHGWMLPRPVRVAVSPAQ